MKLAMLSEASQSWKQMQERGFEQATEHAATAVHKFVTRSLAARDSSSTCKADDDSAQCQKPTTAGNTQTIAIVLGAGIPLACAAIVLVFLHRRHVRNQKLEDMNDPHKSLDFGMGNTGMNKWDKQKQGKQGIPEMTVTDLGSDPAQPGKRPRGMSMDMGSPYLLPAELNDSHGSLHSMSRASFQDEHDPYRPVNFLKSDADSIRSGRKPGDNGSVYSAATSMQSSENSGLIANAQRMSRSFPQRGESKMSSSPLSPSSPTGSDELPTRQMHSQKGGMPPSRKVSGDSVPTLPIIQEPERAHSPNTFSPPPPPPPPEEKMSPPPRTSSASAGPVNRPPRKDSVPVPPKDSVDYNDVSVMPASPPRIERPESQYDMDIIDSVRFSLDGPEPSSNLAKPTAQNQRLSVMGLRPLPSDVPEDNPEQRANRIRSFYKEYFDDSKPNPSGPPAGDMGLGDGAIFDPETGTFVTAHRPFAQPVGRRAMTPPPRGAPSPRAPGPFNPHRRHNSTQSAAGRGGPRGRPMMGSPMPPPMPRKRAPPPSPLKSLPTPHLLKDDTAIFNADDFAPPVSYRDRQAGRRPDSPMGTARPYSPAVSSHVPLQDTMTELAAIPSPYLLRKSGTFTSLDFAPPGRLGGGDGGGSDAGSIRSNRSAVSAMQQNAIRGGAYRVSRLPTDMVSTKDDLAAQLKPSWDMRRGDNIMG